MNKFYSLSGSFILAMGVTLSGWAANPCMPIAQACMQEGFYKGGSKVGKGLVENCVMPVVAGTKTLPNATFTADVLQQCGVKLKAKMGQN